MLSYRARFFLVRVLNVIRPKPTVRPLTVEEVLTSTEGRDLVERFREFAYGSGTGNELSWRGMPMLKNPSDVWMVVELMQQLRPRVIVETGTHHGASATFYADMAATLGIDCAVVTVDINPKWSYDPASKGIRSLVGYSTAPDVVREVEQIVAEATAGGSGAVMVMLDSDHSTENVANELRLYSKLVTADSYLIVEDTNTAPPRAAVDAFLAETDEFIADESCERFLITYYPGGWLRRVRPSAA